VTNPATPAPPVPLNAFLDYELLDPSLNEEQVLDGCANARRLAIHCVVVRPCDVDAAVRTGVRVGSVAGWPSGVQTTGVKLYEVRDLLRRGVKEVDFVLNPSSLRSRQFQNVEMELLQAVETCHKERAIVKIVFPAGILNFEAKLVGARICSRVGPDFAVISDEADIAALRPHFSEDIGMKFAMVDSRETLVRLQNAGCTRFGTSAADAILSGVIPVS
jgi:deoxyribose-phosphate aldolase